MIFVAKPTSQECINISPPHNGKVQCDYMDKTRLSDGSSKTKTVPEIIALLSKGEISMAEQAMKDTGLSARSFKEAGGMEAVDVLVANDDLIYAAQTVRMLGCEKGELEEYKSRVLDSLHDALAKIFSEESNLPKVSGSMTGFGYVRSYSTAPTEVSDSPTKAGLSGIMYSDPASSTKLPRPCGSASDIAGIRALSSRKDTRERLDEVADIAEAFYITNTELMEPIDTYAAQVRAALLQRHM